VTDRRTCLTWEKKTGAYASNGSVSCTGAEVCPDPHSVNNLYTWSTGAPWAFNGTASTVFLKQLNDAAFAGHTDWRLPMSAGVAPYPTGSNAELESILTALYPSIDPVFDPTAVYYWSSSPLDAYPTQAWYVYLGDGRVHDGNKGNGGYVRAVRGGP